MNEIGDHELMRRLESVAASLFDGHLTIMKFTTNWRVGFGTPFDRYDIRPCPSGGRLQTRRGARWPMCVRHGATRRSDVVAKRKPKPPNTDPKPDKNRGSTDNLKMSLSNQKSNRVRTRHVSWFGRTGTLNKSTVYRKSSLVRNRQ